jgi:hypothetical protein
MRQSALSPWLIAPALTLLGWIGTPAEEPRAATPGVPAGAAIGPNCSIWTLDGYRIGMGGTEILAVRSITIHVWGQAQAIEPGKLRGVLVLDASNHLEKWDVAYDKEDGEKLRAEMRERLGEPASDVSGTIIDDGPDSVRQRRTIWQSPACDAAIIVYENTSVRGTPGHSVNATLARASMFRPGFAEAKSLFP